MWYIKIELINQDQLAWSQFFIKMVGVHLHNSTHDNRNLDKLYDNLIKKFIFGTKCSSLWEEKITINQIISSKLWYIGQAYTIPKRIWKKMKKAISTWPTKYNTSQKPSLAPHIWKGGLGILDSYSAEFSNKDYWILWIC